jgi:hypothetical protein
MSPHAARSIALATLVSIGCSNEHDTIIDPDAALTSDADVDGPVQPSCATTATASVTNGGDSYTYVAFGHVDTGGESSCGSPGDTVEIALAVTAAFLDRDQLLTFRMPLPVTTGAHTVTIDPPGDQPAKTATFEVTNVTLDGAGPELDLLEGSLSGPGISGSLSARGCALLDVYCI